MVPNLGQIVLVKDIRSGSNSSDAKNLTTLNGQLYFSANDGINGKELWVTDGTTSGTKLVENINPGSANSNADNLIVFKNELYFTADDGVNRTELWVSDGTVSGTKLVADINPGEFYFNYPSGSYPRDLTVFNNKLYFSADSTFKNRELWSSDGTTAGTQLVKNIGTSGFTNYYGSYPQDFTVLNNKLYFTADDGIKGSELWVTDGTTAGTKLVKDINPVIGSNSLYSSSYPSNLIAFNNKLYFTASGEGKGKELWVSDGTTAGTQLVKDINPGISSGYGFGSDPAANNFAVFQNKLYFNADNGVDGNELWVTDGTENGTQLVADINTGGSNDSYIRDFIEFNSKLYFTADNGVNGREIWVTNGTAAGTQLVVDINPGSGSANADNFTLFQNKLYFTADDGVNGRELWVSDGTTAGTQLVADINPGINASNPDNLTIVGNELFFTADNGTTGRELFKLTFDGSTTITGTSLADSLNGTKGADRIEGLNGNDTLNGKSGNDTLLGGNGNDNLVGGAGNDSLLGNSGGDVISGGIGNDTLNGSTGFDILTGGTGNDIFVVKKGNGSDSVVDFQRGSDKLGLAGDLEFGDLTLAGNTIKSGNELLATLIGVNTGNLTEANFTTV
jgi:ELWxxDGT repeat protein